MKLEDRFEPGFRSPIRYIKKVVGPVLLTAGMASANLPAYAQEGPETQEEVKHTVLNPVGCRDAEVTFRVLDESLQPEKEVTVRVADCNQRGVFVDNRFRVAAGVEQGEDVVLDRYTYDKEGNLSYFPPETYCNDERGTKEFSNRMNGLDSGSIVPILIRDRDDERDSHCGVSGGKYNNSMDRLAGLVERMERLVPSETVTGGGEPEPQPGLPAGVPSGTGTEGEPVAQPEATTGVDTGIVAQPEAPETSSQAPQSDLEIYLAHLGVRGGAEVNPYYVEELENGNFYLDRVLRVGRDDEIIFSNNPEHIMELSPMDIVKPLYNSVYAKLSDVIQHTRNAEYLSLLGKINGGDFDLFKSLLENEEVNNSFSQNLVRSTNGDGRNEIEYDTFVDGMGVMVVRDLAGQMATADLVTLSRRSTLASFLKGNESPDVMKNGGNPIKNYFVSSLLPGDDIILGRMTNYTGRMLDGDLKRGIKRVTEACKNEQYGGSYDASQTVRCLEDGYKSIPKIDTILNGGGQ